MEQVSKKHWAICLIQPLAMFLVLIPQDLWISILSEPIGLGYGISFIIIASTWSFVTDRAGRPGMESTHKTIQAYLASQGMILKMPKCLWKNAQVKPK